MYCSYKSIACLNYSILLQYMKFKVLIPKQLLFILAQLYRQMQLTLERMADFILQPEKKLLLNCKYLERNLIKHIFTSRMMTELPGFVGIAFYYSILQSSQLSNFSHLLFPAYSQLHLKTLEIFLVKYTKFDLRICFQLKTS